MLLLLTSISLGCAATAWAQEAAQGTEGPAWANAPVVPQQVRYAGKLATRAGDTVEAEFRIYAAAEGGEPLWTETQKVPVSEDGAYSVLLGSGSPAGLSQAVFAGGAARWLGVSVERAPEQERVLLSSVPYAMKSADAESLGGHAASDFVTQEQLAQIAQIAQAAQLAQSGGATGQKAATDTGVVPDLSGTVTGSGTTGTVPLWTGALTQGNSLITQAGTSIGINEATPAATLDVNGTAQFRGTLTLPATSTATSSSGEHSNLLNFAASAWSSTASAAVSPSFEMFAYPESNNTASPTAKFYMQYRLGSAVTNLFTINNAGVIGFAAGQTFPGTITGVSATSPVTATTTSGAVKLGLNMSAIETTLNTLYPQLGTGNVFKSYIQAVQSGGPLTAALIGAGTNESTGALANSDTGLGAYGSSSAPKDGESGVLGSTGKPFTFSNTYNNLATAVNPHIAGVWGDTTGNPNPGIYEKAAGVLGTADDAYAGAFYNNSAGNYTVWAEALGGSDAVGASSEIGWALHGFSLSGAGAAGEATSGWGLYGSSNTGDGVHANSGTGAGVSGQATGFTPGTSADGVSGITLTPSKGSAGVFGDAYAKSSSYLSIETSGFVAGVWGDAANPNDGSGANSPGIIGTADDHAAGIFVNDSATHTTVSIVNSNSSGGTGLFKTLSASTPHGTCGIGGDGDLSCTGQVKSLVSTAGGARRVETYAMQSPENWMEDFGSGKLQQGVAVIMIDRTFAETVSETSEYHVFLTPKGDSKGLYVINETAGSFEVRESGGGTSSLAFDYRIVGKRRGYEAQRLTDVTERFKAESEALLPTKRVASSPSASVRPVAHKQPRLPTADGGEK